ncbi:MAG: tetratricopeptide repeat-containing sensor histidine kinase [Candidatus Kapaibacteriota bacterium]
MNSFALYRRAVGVVFTSSLWLFGILAAPSLSAQTPVLDSLRTVLSTVMQDSARVRTLTRLTWELRVIDPVQSIIYGREALGLVRQESNSRQRSEIHRFMGVAYRNIGEYNKAAEETYSALTLDEARGDSVEIGHSLNTLGRIMLLENNIDKASSYIHRAVALAEHLGDEKLLAYCLFTLADLHYERKEYPLALATAEKVAAMRRKRGEIVSVADVYLAIAKGLTAIQRYDQARSYIEQSLEIYRTNNIPYNLVTANNAMARLLLAMQRPSESIEYGITAMRIAASIGAKGLEQEAASLLSEGYAAEGNFQAALAMHKRYKALSDTILSEKSARHQALLDIGYETKIKEQKIQAFEREKRFNVLLAILIAGIIMALALSLLILSRRNKLGSKETTNLKVRAESLADRNDALRLAQLELEESHQQLSQALREIQLQNTELSDLNQEKNMILGMVSHDLKNPIGAVQGLSEMMVGEDFTEEQYKEFASVILETSNRMFALVKNFLDVARAEDGRMRMTLIQFDITNVIEMALESFRRQAFEKSITIHYDKPTSPVTVYGDESLVMQVLDNLISNAIKYTPPGKDIAVNIAELQILRHNVTLFNDDMDTLDASAFVKCVRISITDEGPGLTDLDKTKLFGKFARLSAQPTGGESSTGLGLAITKRLVELMKGRVWCESEFGFGSRFTVELPSQPD